MIVFLFGLPGAGKTYLGQLLAEHWTCPYWDGDEALTEEMKASVLEEKPFTKEMTQTLSKRMMDNMTRLSESNSTFIVSQAMLLETDRQLFKQSFPEVRFIYIYCDKNTMLQRITSRANFVTRSFCEKLQAAFKPYEADALTYPSINNSDKEDKILIEELKIACLENSSEYNSDRFFSRVSEQSNRPNYSMTQHTLSL